MKIREIMTMLLDICTKNYSYESVFNYLKTGLTNIQDVNDIDIIENYVLEWGIKGSTWQKEWTWRQIQRRLLVDISRYDLWKKNGGDSRWAPCGKSFVSQ